MSLSFTLVGTGPAIFLPHLYFSPMISLLATLAFLPYFEPSKLRTFALAICPTWNALPSALKVFPWLIPRFYSGLHSNCQLLSF